MSYNYNPSSQKAEEFINHEEILETLSYAEKNKNNVELIDQILAKARLRKGLSHREAAVLLDCEIPEKVEEIFELARQIKQDFYGNRIVMFAPLYLSNYCVNGCVYCPYHMKNKHIARKKLTQEEIRREVIALQDMGHKRLALETGEDPVNNPIEYVLDSIKTIYSIKHKNGAIRRVNVNIAATTVENYRKLKEAGIGTYILFQETYHKESYERLHPTGPKHNYCYHTEAMDRAMEGGIDDVGIGVLFGLELYRYEFAGLLMHAEHLEAVFGVGPHTISVPRIRRADDIDPSTFDNGISDDIFEKIVAGGGKFGAVRCERQPDTRPGGPLADGIRLYPKLLYGVLPGRTDGRPLYEPVQERADSELLSSECADDAQGVSGGLCGAGDERDWREADSGGDRFDSERKSAGDREKKSG